MVRVAHFETFVRHEPPTSPQQKKSILDWLQTILLPIVLALFFRFGPTTLPDNLSEFLGVSLIVTILATAVDTIYPYVKGWRRKHEFVHLPSQREEFRAFLMEVKANTEYMLWTSLSHIVKEPDTGTYASIVYGLFADVSGTIARIYANFEPSTISHDLFESHKDRLNRLSSEHAYGVMSVSMNLKSNPLPFTKAVEGMSKFLIEIRRDVVNKPAVSAQS
jgi:hypothetical protein